MSISDHQRAQRKEPETLPLSGVMDVVIQPAATGYFLRTDNQYQDILCRLADGGVYVYNRNQQREIFIPLRVIDTYCR